MGKQLEEVSELKMISVEVVVPLLQFRKAM